MAKELPLIVHASHEAGVKVGGIGAVLHGLLASPGYNRNVDRSILAGPMFGWDAAFMERLNAPGNQLSLRFSSLHGVFDGVDSDLEARLRSVEETYRVALLYGTRRFGAYEHEVLLVDATHPNPSPIDAFKFYVWRNYGVDSLRYQFDSEYNLYVATAQPLMAALRALNPDQGVAAGAKIILAHEWLGMPLVFAAQMLEPDAWRTVFYAHETATARRIVEEHGGHDTRFYNVLDRALGQHLFMDDLFGSQDDWFKTAILHQASRCDGILAVGDRVVDELRFMSQAFRERRIDLVYNGLPPAEVTVEEKRASKRRLQAYCRNMLGYQPDFVFTHVARMNLSKALWRDLRVMEHLDAMLEAEGKTAVLFILATALPSGRRSEQVMAWEFQYGWPVGHRADNGDLVDLEATFFFHGVEPLNNRQRNVRVVLVNQFGWSRERCGLRMPDDMEFADIRRGSDLEFGQSIYEPFGIAQVEPLGYGALCCFSSVCGCAGFVRRALEDDEADAQNIIVSDYVTVPPEHPLHSPYDALFINHGTRDWIEGLSSREAAAQIFRRLPRSPKAIRTLLDSGRRLATAMSWDVVADDYLMPALRRVCTD